MLNWKGNERRIILFLVTGLIFVAALFAVEEPPKVWDSAFSPAIEIDVLEDLARHTNVMMSRNTQPSKILMRINQVIPMLSADDRTHVLYKYHAYLLAQLPAYDKKIFYQGNHKMVYKYFYYAYQPQWISTIEEKPFRDVMEELHSSGYLLKRSRNLYHPFIDYTRLEETFAGASDEGLKYLEIKALEDIVIERGDPKKTSYYKNVEKLLLKCDYFINRYPLSEKNHEIQSLFNEELNNYIFGNKLFESYDNFTGKVDQSLLNSYLSLSKNLRSENLGLMLNRYTKMVMRNDRVVVNDFLQYIYTGIQKNRSDYIVTRTDHVNVRTELMSFAGEDQYIPKIEGYRYVNLSDQLNEKLLQNVYKYVYQGWNRGYQVQDWGMSTSYEVTFARADYLSIYQSIVMTYGNGQKILNVECLNFNFATREEVAFKDLFVDFNLQKRKIKEVLEQGVTNFDIGTFQQIETIDLESINNFVITNDGIEVFIRVLDESGSKVGSITVELSFSEFYTKIEPDFRL